MNTDDLTPAARKLLTFLVSRGVQTAEEISAALAFDKKQLTNACEELARERYGLSSEAQTDGSTVWWIDHAVEISSASYVIQDAPTTRCPQCDRRVKLLTPKIPGRAPIFYICWPCNSVFESGKDPVAFDNGSMPVSRPAAASQAGTS
jgi:hypothetical protein